MRRLQLLLLIVLAFFMLTLFTSCDSEEMVMGTENAPAKLVCIVWDTNGIEGNVHYQIYKGDGSYVEKYSTSKFLTVLVEKGDYMLVQIESKGLDQAVGQIFCKLKVYTDNSVYFDGNENVGGMGASFLIK